MGDGSGESDEPPPSPPATSHPTGEADNGSNETGDALEEEADLLMTLATEPEADAATRLHMYKQEPDPKLSSMVEWLAQ